MAVSPFQRKNWNASLSLTICIRIILPGEPVRCLLNLNCADIRLVAVKRADICVKWTLHQFIQRWICLSAWSRQKSVRICFVTQSLSVPIRHGRLTLHTFQWSMDFFIWQPLSTGTAVVSLAGMLMILWIPLWSSTPVKKHLK